MRSHDAGSRERSAFESAKRACYAGLDSATLREELVRRAAGVLRTEAFSFSVTDPEVGLFVHSIAEGVPDAAGYQFMTEIYPAHEAALLLDQARAGTVVSTTESPLYAWVSPLHQRRRRRHHLLPDPPRGYPLSRRGHTRPVLGSRSPCSTL